VKDRPSLRPGQNLRAERGVRPEVERPGGRTKHPRPRRGGVDVRSFLEGGEVVAIGYRAVPSGSEAHRVVVGSRAEESSNPARHLVEWRAGIQWPSRIAKPMWPRKGIAQGSSRAGLEGFGDSPPHRSADCSSQERVPR